MSQHFFAIRQRNAGKESEKFFFQKEKFTKETASTNLPIDQPFILEVVFRATSAVQALSVTSLSLLKITSVQK